MMKVFFDATQYFNNQENSNNSQQLQQKIEAANRVAIQLKML